MDDGQKDDDDDESKDNPYHRICRTSTAALEMDSNLGTMLRTYFNLELLCLGLLEFCLGKFG